MTSDYYDRDFQKIKIKYLITTLICSSTFIKIVKMIIIIPILGFINKKAKLFFDVKIN